MRRHYLALIALALACVVGPSALYAQSNWNFPEFEEATAAYKREDCQTAWDLMWPLAKAGKHEARYFLSATTNLRLIPPGNASLSWRRTTQHKLTLAAYTAIGPVGAKPFHADPTYLWARREIPIYISELSLGSPGDRVARCYKSDSSFQDCLRLAVSLGIIQRFDAYAEELDAEEKKTGTRASCRARPW